MSSTSCFSNRCMSEELESWISNPETRTVRLPGLTCESVLWKITAGTLITIPSFPRALELAIEEPTLGFVSDGIFQSLELKGHQEGDSSSVSNLKEQTKHQKLDQSIVITVFFLKITLVFILFYNFIIFIIFCKHSMKQKEQHLLYRS